MIYAFPFLMLLVGVCFHVVQARRRRGAGRYLDLGQAFLLVVLVYSIVPGMGFLLAHLGVGEIIDQRLSAGFNVTRIEAVQAMLLAYAASFSFAYLCVRRHCRSGHYPQPAAAEHARNLVVFAVALALLLPLTLGVFGGSGTDYISSYTALRSAPLLVQQLFGVANQLSFGALVAAIVFSVAAAPKRHVRIAAVLLVYLIYSALGGGSRSAAFLGFFAYLVAASVYVRGFSLGRIALLGFPALVLFMLAGYLRDANPDATYLGLFQTGEFTALFINAVDLQERFDDGFAQEIRFAFYFVDLIRLIPSQLVGGTKLDPAQWYVETFYPDYHEAGGGLAFGVMAESVAGLGVPEAAARGAIVGLVFAWAANRLIEGRPTPTQVFVYCWMVVLAYQSFRDTTLSLAVRALYQLVPLLLVIAVTRPRRRTRRRPKVANQHLQSAALGTSP